MWVMIEALERLYENLITTSCYVSLVTVVLISANKPISAPNSAAASAANSESEMQEQEQETRDSGKRKKRKKAKDL